MKNISLNITSGKEFHQENDENINYDDIPATDAKFWENAQLVKWDFHNKELVGNEKGE